MSIISVDTRARKPIYEQLIDNITELICHGMLAPDEQLPAVRALASELAINPNTIAKSYAELERRGLIYTLHGRGSFVTDNAAAISERQREKALAELEASVKAALAAGIEKERILALIANYGGEQK